MNGHVLVWDGGAWTVECPQCGRPMTGRRAGWLWCGTCEIPAVEARRAA